jgi:hypothetical protein
MAETNQDLMSGWESSSPNSQQVEQQIDDDHPLQGPPNKIYGINRTTAMMGLMFIGGLVWVFFASHQFDPPEKDSAAISQQAIISAGLADMTRATQSKTAQRQKMRALIRAINFEAKHRQVPLEDLNGNPFVFTGRKKTPAPKKLPDKPLAQPTDQPQEQEPQAPPISHLRLQSVLLGNPKSATISGHMVNEGQNISGWTVKRIEVDRVILQWRNQQYELKIR